MNVCDLYGQELLADKNRYPNNFESLTHFLEHRIFYQISNSLHIDYVKDGAIEGLMHLMTLIV